MATHGESAGTGLVPYRVTVRQFEKMIGANLFREGEHVELLGGVLVSIAKSTTHNFLVTHLGYLLRPFLPDPWFLSEEKAVRMGRFWRIEPDFAVVRGPHRTYAQRYPGPADIGLLIEVADSSYAKDAGIKLRRYATARVPVY